MIHISDTGRMTGSGLDFEETVSIRNDGGHTRQLKVSKDFKVRSYKSIWKIKEINLTNRNLTKARMHLYYRGD